MSDPNATFTWVPDYDSEVTKAPRVLTAEFGDGYAQVAPDGINNNPATWSLSFKSRTDEEAGEIVDFLETQGADEAFWWTDLFGQMGRYRCPTFKRKPMPGAQSEITATFEQTFDLSSVGSSGGSGGSTTPVLVYFGFTPTTTPDATAVEALHSRLQTSFVGGYGLTQDGSTSNYPCFAIPASLGTPNRFAFAGFTYSLIESSVSISGVSYNVFINPSPTYAEVMNWSAS